VNKTSVFQLARRRYHAALLGSGVLCLTVRKKPKKGLPEKFPSNADGDSATSISIAQGIFDQIESETRTAGRLAGQVSGSKFEHITRVFIEETFPKLGALRPGKWDFAPDLAR
jgi:hypothetical protein